MIRLHTENTCSMKNIFRILGKKRVVLGGKNVYLEAKKLQVQILHTILKSIGYNLG